MKNKIMKPNIYRWATSELTQDAFICWLLEWAKPEFKDTLLNEIALKLIEELSSIREEKINEIEVRKQYKNIDIMVIINEKSAILIEDKVHTQDHSDQLTRYAEILQKEFSKENLSLIYLKTGDQSNYSKVKSKGYKIFRREDFLKLLKEGEKKGIKNEIFTDFLEYLDSIDKSVNSFEILPIDQWHWDSWKGFYMELQRRLGQGEWNYVPQKNGGFLGFWWNWKHMDYKETGFDYYLQLEQGKFCFKIIPNDINLNHEIRDFYRSILFKKAKEYGLEIKKNGRCIKGKTKTMTVAKLDPSYMMTDTSNIIDLECTVEKIREIENVINAIEKAYNIETHNETVLL